MGKYSIRFHSFRLKFDPRQQTKKKKMWENVQDDKIDKKGINLPMAIRSIA